MDFWDWTEELLFDKSHPVDRRFNRHEDEQQSDAEELKQERNAPSAPKGDTPMESDYQLYLQSEAQALARQPKYCAICGKEIGPDDESHIASDCSNPSVRVCSDCMAEF